MCYPPYDDTVMGDKHDGTRHTLQHDTVAKFESANLIPALHVSRPFETCNNSTSHTVCYI